MSQLLRKKNSIFKTTMLSSCSSSTYQYLQRSKIPTMHFQRSLPRLPIPLLEKSCERFLNAVRPILLDSEFEETFKCTNDFRNDTGKQLQSMLQKMDKSNKKTSYISEPWFDMYLKDRAPLPLNYNPLLVMKSESRTEFQSPIIRATNLVISSLRFWRSLQANLLEPEVFHMNPKKSDTDSFKKVIGFMPTVIATYAAYAFKAFPLDMSQYNKLFGVTRIPSIGKDKLVQNPESKHILVLKGGRMYTVNVLDGNGNIEAPEVILGRLQKIESAYQQKGPNDVSLGILTTEQRDEWALIRNYLENEISTNNKNLLQNEIDAALFCLCLDTSDDPVNNESDPTPLYKHLLAGNASNRWFDKSVSLIISCDGTASVNFEHSWGDGVAVMRYFNEIYSESTQKPFVSSNTVPAKEFDNKNVRELNFDIDDKLREYVNKANNKNLALINNLEMNILRCTDLNKVVCKHLGISPDFVMQLSFQLAYRIVYGTYVGTYESCSTAAFLHGRTETMRPCTMSTKQLCEEILNSDKKLTQNPASLIKSCSAYHSQLVKEAAMGQGFDRHLFALKYLADTTDTTLPKFYDTAGYKKINNSIISTSTLASKAISAGSFGPVTKNGFGIGYSIQNDESGAIVTSYKNERNGKDFLQGLELAQKYIKKLITTSK